MLTHVEHPVISDWGSAVNKHQMKPLGTIGVEILANVHLLVMGIPWHRHLEQLKNLNSSTD